MNKQEISLKIKPCSKSGATYILYIFRDRGKRMGVYMHM